MGGDGVAGDGLNHVGGLAEGAGGAGRDGDTGLVKHEEDGFAFGTSERDVEDVGEEVVGVAVDGDVWDFGGEAGAEVVAERADGKFIYFWEVHLCFEEFI